MGASCEGDSQLSPQPEQAYEGVRSWVSGPEWYRKEILRISEREKSK